MKYFLKSVLSSYINVLAISGYLSVNLDPNQAIRKDVQDLQVTQQQFLTYHVQFQQQQQQQAALDPHTAQTLQVVSAEQVSYAKFVKVYNNLPHPLPAARPPLRPIIIIVLL